MKLNDLVAMPVPSEPDVAHLTPIELRREIARLLAAGVLRLLSRRGSLPETKFAESEQFDGNLGFSSEKP